MGCGGRPGNHGAMVGGRCGKHEAIVVRGFLDHIPKNSICKNMLFGQVTNDLRV